MANDSHPAYRADIDGLRAIAVTAVVAFHTTPAVARGGYLGVDIFFVISGYLITQLLLREAVKTRSIALVEFYARRIRRLFPALVTMVAAVLIAAHFLLLPIVEQPRVAQSAIATSVYASNFFFKLAAGDYFAGPSAQQPLLHTWSLAVEEQYYLFWPIIVLVVTWAVRRSKIDLRSALSIALVPLVIGSFFLYMRWSTAAPSSAFYYLPARAWELGAGALLALMLEGESPRSHALTSEVLFAIGLAVLIASVLLIDRDDAPGPAIAIPVLGAVACLAAGARGSRVAQSVLGRRGPVEIGKVSYSWYLWHWPLLAIARARALGAANAGRDWMLALIALGLATLTLKLVENPIRYRKPGPFARKWPTITVGLGLSGMVIGGAILLVVIARHQATEPRYAELVAVRKDVSPLRERCHLSGRLAPRAECTIKGNDPKREVVVWGDSHAERMFAPVAEFARIHAISAVERTSTACPPLIGVSPSTSDRRPNRACLALNDAVLEELAERVRSGHRVAVVLAARWQNYLGGISPEGVPARILFDRDAAPGKPAELFERGLEATIDKLATLGIRAVLVADVPELRRSAPECLIRDPEHCSIPRADAERYRAPSQQLLERALHQHAGEVRLVDAFGALCDPNECSPMLNGKLAYTDAHHLAFSAAATLVSYFDGALRWALAP